MSESFIQRLVRSRLSLCMALVCLVGCRPSEKTVTGQVFVMESESESIKLGLVAVSLIEQSQVEEYLASKNKTLTEQRAALQASLAMAETKLNQAHSKYTAFIATNSQAIAEGELVILERFDKIPGNELRGLLHATRNAQSQYLEARAPLEAFPPEDFFIADLPPVVFKTATTDADGKFTFNYPARAKFAVFAVTSRPRALLWFFWLPEIEKGTPLLLSNHNLVWSDYQGNILPATVKKTASP